MKLTVGLIVTAFLSVTVSGKKPVCEKTVEDCPNSFFTVNQKTCDCECTELMCIATMSVDTENCQCVPIIEPELRQKPISEFELEYLCDDDGYKVCPDKPKSCQPGSVYDGEACACFTFAKCRKMCPPGQVLDPREMCSCIPIAEKEALNRCGDW